MRFLIPFSLVLLAACDQSEPPPSTLPDQAPVADASGIGEMMAFEGNLAGEYRVAGVGGGEIDLPHAITMSISADRIHMTSDCVDAEWSYHFEGAILATERVPLVTCQRGLFPEEEALIAAFDGADRVEHLPSGAYEFTGTGPQATLFTQ